MHAVQIRPIATDVCSVHSLRVLSVVHNHELNCAKTTEAIDMPFGV